MVYHFSERIGLEVELCQVKRLKNLSEKYRIQAPCRISVIKVQIQAETVKKKERKTCQSFSQESHKSQNFEKKVTKVKILCKVSFKKVKNVPIKSQKRNLQVTKVKSQRKSKPFLDIQWQC